MMEGQREKVEYLFKVLVTGEIGVGKTCFIKRYVHNFFTQHYRATIGVDFALKVINWDDQTTVKVQLWDIAGQERYSSMTRVYYKDAVGALIVFDVTRASTFEAVAKWKKDLDEKVQLADGSPVPTLLVANKCDCPTRDGIVSDPRAIEDFCRETGFIGWYEVSAKDNIRVDEAARALIGKILEKQRSLQQNNQTDAEIVKLDGRQTTKSTNEQKSSGCSC